MLTETADVSVVRRSPVTCCSARSSLHQENLTTASCLESQKQTHDLLEKACQKGHILTIIILSTVQASQNKTIYSCLHTTI